MNDIECIFNGDANQVKVTTSDGPLIILKNHAPYMAKLSGTIEYTDSYGKTINTKADGGIIYTNGNKCVIIMD